MKTTLKYALLAGAVAASPVALAEDAKCTKVSETVMTLVSKKPDNVLAIVERQTAANPTCACEVVKAAIVATEANPKLVGQIVGAAVEAAPDKMSVISSCAIAVAPDAITQVKAVLAKLDPKKVAREGNDPVAGGGSDVRDPNDEIYLIPGLPPIHPPLVPSVSTPSDFPNIDILSSSGSTSTSTGTSSTTTP